VTTQELLSMRIPPAFRGNCECGRWIVVCKSVPHESPLMCDCARSHWYDSGVEEYQSHPHPVVFLDFDGVLTNFMTGFTRGHPDCVEQLNRITDETEAVIIVSSSWRRGGLDKIRSILHDWGVTGQAIGVTPDLARKNDSGVWRAVQRGSEIALWMTRNRREFERFVILDDESDMMAVIAFLVKTDTLSGLTSDEADRAIEILTEGPL
jgi:hypothetical protein